MAEFPENGPKSKLPGLFLLIEGLQIISLQTARNMIDMSLIWSAEGNLHNEVKTAEVSLIYNSARMSEILCLF